MAKLPEDKLQGIFYPAKTLTLKGGDKVDLARESLVKNVVVMKGQSNLANGTYELEDGTKHFTVSDGGVIGKVIDGPIPAPTTDPVTPADPAK